VGQLRQKLRAIPQSAELIATEPGIGYRILSNED
jgi:DNA-binding winged helix-turn-helix (wHTH) protein